MVVQSGGIVLNIQIEGASSKAIRTLVAARGDLARASF